MLYKEYGSTGKKVTAVSFGGMRFPDPDNIDASAEIVLHAYRRGINYFDTAPGYCKDRSEDIIGAAVRRMDRKKIFVSTKCMAADGKDLRASLDRSLKRLNVERIDFFHIWCIVTPDGWQQRKAGGAVAAAIKAKSEGLIEHLVVSSHLAGPDLRAILAEGLFEGVTLGYCAINFPYRQEAVDATGKLGLGVVTMNPLGGGLIPSNADRFDFIRSKDDESVVAAALRFNLSQPAITSALVGFSNARQVDEAVAAVENFQPYPASHIQSMQGKIIGAFDGFCTGCGYCLPCPKGVDVPRMMDSYNLKLLGKADDEVASRLKWHWNMSASDANACALCGDCQGRCTQKLPIQNRLKEIARIESK